MINNKLFGSETYSAAQREVVDVVASIECRTHVSADHKSHCNDGQSVYEWSQRFHVLDVQPNRSGAASIVTEIACMLLSPVLLANKVRWMPRVDVQHARRIMKGHSPADYTM